MKLITCTINKHHVEIEKAEAGSYILYIDLVSCKYPDGKNIIFKSQKAAHRAARHICKVEYGQPNWKVIIDKVIGDHHEMLVRTANR
jgi:hypothetical protein